MITKNESNEENISTINVKIPKMEGNTSMKLTHLNSGEYILSELDNKNEFEMSSDYVDKATYDFTKTKHIYNQIIDNDNSSYVTTSEQICNLAKNPQNSIDKVLTINGIIKYYINKDDLIGRVVEIIENNVNTNFKLDYPYKPKTKKDTKIFEEYKEKVINKFNKQIDIKKLIINNALKVYIEGNYIFYLKGDLKNGYGIANYPLDIIEVTPMTIDGDNVVAFKVNELNSRLNKVKSKYGKLKTNKLIDIETLIDAEIKRDYSEEIYNAYKGKDQVALLDPKRIGLTRINNLGTGLYGVSPIFKILDALLMLETIDNSDREILKARSKKIYYQKTRKELMGKDYDHPNKPNEVGYAHTNLLQCMANNTIVYTSMPFVESLEILEPKTELTDPKTKESYVLKCLTGLGISFVSSEGTTSITTVKMVFNELLKMVNRITKQLESIIHKYYELITEENGYPIEFVPNITIQETEYLDLDSKMKLAETLYSKIGLSYESVLSALGLDVKSEVEKRKAENEEKYSEIFEPYGTSFTTSNKDNNSNSNTDENKNSNGSNKSDNRDKVEYDKQRQETIK